jgi:putative ABC transport system permease protein
MRSVDYNMRARWFEAVGRDLRLAVRLIAKSPGFTAAVVGSLAVGIAANVGLFSVVNGMFLRPLPYDRPEELVEVSQPRQILPLSELRRARSFEGVAAFIPRGFAVAGGDGVKQVFGFRVSANVFSVLGVQPALGRTFAIDEDQGPVVVLSYEYWRQVSGDPKIIGRALTIGDEKYTVIGILPSDFTLWFRDAYLFIPYRLNEGRLVARLSPGVTRSQAAAEVGGIVGGLPPEPGWTGHDDPIRVQPFDAAFHSNDASTLLLLQAAAVLALLITCANIANLLLVRSVARRKEFAIRAAIGAGRMQVVRQLLIENSLLAVLGGAIGLLLAELSLDFINAKLPANIGRALRGSDGLAIDHRVLAFTAGASLLTIVLFGTAPLLNALRFDVMTCLRDSARGAAPERQRFGYLLISGEVAMALILLTGAALTLKSFIGLQTQRLGFSPDHVLRAAVDLQASRHPRPEQRVAVLADIVERLQELPGVETAGAVAPQAFPFGGPAARGSVFEIQGRPGAEPRADVYVASPGYFRSVRIPLFAGRVFTSTDTAATTPVAVISEIVAKRYWGREDPIGHFIRLDAARADSPWVTVIGVVGDIHNPLAPEAQPTIYRAFAQTPTTEGFVMIRTAADPMTLVSAIRRELRAVDPTTPDSSVKGLESEVSSYTSPQRFTTSVFGFFAGLSLLLAALGVYGVVKYWVGARIPEIGVRLALGAGQHDVLRLVLGRAAQLTLAGVAAGLAGAFALQRVIVSQLYGVSPADPMVLATVSFIMCAVALAAAFFPARRAARTDPLVALRHE